MNDIDFQRSPGPWRDSLLEQVIENLTDTVYFMDLAGRVVRINWAGACWLGYATPEEVVGKTDLDLFTGEHGEKAYQDAMRIMRTGLPVINQEEKETHQDGRVTWVSTTRMPLTDEQGAIVGLFGLSRDITDLKEQELRMEDINRRMQAELGLARDLQRSFLPPEHMFYPPVGRPGSPRAEIAYWYQPSGEVGGDYFTVLPVTSHAVGLFIADVMGHGVEAALLMSALNAMAHHASFPRSSPSGFLEAMNNRIQDILPGLHAAEFITAFYMVLDLETGIARYASAGHHSPLLIRQNGDEISYLHQPGELGGTALLMLENATYREQKVTFDDGDQLMIFTDGLFELPYDRRPDTEIGLDGLMRIVPQISYQTLQELNWNTACQVMKEAAVDAFDDDVCIVSLAFRRS